VSGLKEERDQSVRLLRQAFQQGQITHALPSLPMYTSLKLKQQHVLEKEEGNIYKQAFNIPKSSYHKSQIVKHFTL
jgi:hypothetical protein